MNNIAFIWDLDGTLLDSYEIIVNSLYQVYSEKGIIVDKQEILVDCITKSVNFFIKKMEENLGIPFDDLIDRYSEISQKQKLNIKPMEHAIEILSFLKENKIPNYVFTHRGITTESVLKNIGLFDFFDEIVTSLNKFQRKPNPEGIDYIINKYKLDKDNTYYVGDRPIDIDCANNAGIKSIMFIPQNSVAERTGKETFVVRNLLEIKNLINLK